MLPPLLYKWFHSVLVKRNNRVWNVCLMVYNFSRWTTPTLSSVIPALRVTTVCCRARAKSVQRATTAQRALVWTGRLVPGAHTVMWLGFIRRASVNPVPKASTVTENTSALLQVSLSKWSLMVFLAPLIIITESVNLYKESIYLIVGVKIWINTRNWF